MCRRPFLPRGWRDGDPAPAGARRATRHHIVPLSLKRNKRHAINNPRNIVPLCRPCHDLIDQPGPMQRLARSMLRGLMRNSEVEFVGAWMGSGWLQLHYPRPTARIDELTARLRIG
jgi:hypothetical protein